MFIIIRLLSFYIAVMCKLYDIKEGIFKFEI
jgi:hypothetical protein